MRPGVWHLPAEVAVDVLLLDRVDGVLLAPQYVGDSEQVVVY